MSKQAKIKAASAIRRIIAAAKDLANAEQAMDRSRKHTRRELGQRDAGQAAQGNNHAG